MRRMPILFAIVAIVCLASPLAAPGRAAGPPLVITPTSPLAGATIFSSTPNISATFSDSAGQVVPSEVYVLVDARNITVLDNFVVTSGGFYCVIPSILKLPAGNHTVLVSATDTAGNHATYSWGFNVSGAAPPATPLVTVNAGALILDIAIGAGLVGAAVGGYIFYLKQARRFTFKKYFLIHPVKREYLVLYIPGLLAVMFLLLGLLFVFNTPGSSSVGPDYVFIVAIFIGLTAFALDARREIRRMRAFERAFAQFLFEMADAMRGGIDPAKAVIELSKTSTNILRKPLRVAADGIRIGRPFETVLRDMVARMRSPLITRYAGLVADASTVGGETASVVYRAAKDMDDFIKIEVERSKQLVMPVAILYISFGVLMAVLFALLSIAPSLGSINVSILTSGGGSPLPGAGAAPPPSNHLDPGTLRERFFDLMIINSLGIGVIIGAFTEGKARYGLLHSLVLVAATTVAFALLFPA